MEAADFENLRVSAVCHDKLGFQHQLCPALALKCRDSKYPTPPRESRRASCFASKGKPARADSMQARSPDAALYPFDLIPRNYMLSRNPAVPAATSRSAPNPVFTMSLAAQKAENQIPTREERRAQTLKS
jgi:hypothetical protein